MPGLTSRFPNCTSRSRGVFGPPQTAECVRAREGGKIDECGSDLRVQAAAKTYDNITLILSNTHRDTLPYKHEHAQMR